MNEEKCLTCRFFYKHMHPSEQWSIIENYLKQKIELNESKEGMKFCTKNKEFVYPDHSCGNYSSW